MKPIYLGTYKLGPENVRLEADFGSASSEVLIAPTDHGCARMVIGCNDVWSRVVGGLLHEAIEFRLHRQRCAFERSHTLTCEPSRYVFIISHVEHDEMARDVGDFMAVAFSALERAYNNRRNHRKEGKE